MASIPVLSSLVIDGTLTVENIAAGVSDYDRFLVSDGGLIKYRTGAQLLSDIGAQASGNYLLDTTDTFTGTLTIDGALIATQTARIEGSTEIFQLKTDATTGNSYQTWHDAAGRKGYFGFASGVNENIYLINEEAGAIHLGTTTNINDIIVQSTGNFIVNRGTLALGNIPAETTDVDRFLVSNAGLVKYRTGAELLSDIGAQASGNYLLDTTDTLTGTLTIDGASSLNIGVNDTTTGLISVFGNSTTTGGEIRVYDGASNDTTNDYWFAKAVSGQMQLTGSGTSGSVVLNSTSASIRDGNGNTIILASTIGAYISDPNGDGVFSTTGLTASNTFVFKVGDVDGSLNGNLMSYTQSTGILTINTQTAATVDTDKFMVFDTGGAVKYRTGAQVLSDIGGSSQTLTLGTDNQIPIMNVGGTDFEYSANWAFDSATGTLTLPSTFTMGRSGAGSGTYNLFTDANTTSTKTINIGDNTPVNGTVTINLGSVASTSGSIMAHNRIMSDATDDNQKQSGYIWTSYSSTSRAAAAPAGWFKIMDNTGDDPLTFVLRIECVDGSLISEDVFHIGITGGVSNRINMTLIGTTSTTARLLTIRTHRVSISDQEIWIELDAQSALGTVKMWATSGTLISTIVSGTEPTWDQDSEYIDLADTERTGTSFITTGHIKSTVGSVYARSAKFGTQSTTRGTITIEGNGTGSVLGGAITLAPAADHDSVQRLYVLEAYEDDFRITDWTGTVPYLVYDGGLNEWDFRKNIAVTGDITSDGLNVLGSGAALPSAFWSEDFAVDLGDFTTTGDVVWARVTNEGNGDSFSALSGAIGDKEKSILTVTKTTTQESTYLQYDYKTSTEGDFDFLHVSVDDVIVRRYSGTNAWTTDGVFIHGIASHKIDFIFYRDNSASGGTNQVWVDNVGLYNYTEDVIVETKSVFNDDLSVAGNLIAPNISYLGETYMSGWLHGFNQSGERTFYIRNTDTYVDANFRNPAGGEPGVELGANTTDSYVTIHKSTEGATAKRFQAGWNSTYDGGYIEMLSTSARVRFGQATSTDSGFILAVTGDAKFNGNLDAEKLIINSNSTGYALGVNSTGNVFTANYHQPSTSSTTYNVTTYTHGEGSVVGYLGVAGSGVADVGFANAFGIGTLNAYSMYLMTNDTHRVKIGATSGNVSIGNTNDTYKLDVTGTGRFTGKVHIGTGFSTSYDLNIGTGGLGVDRTIGIEFTGGTVLGSRINADAENNLLFSTRKVTTSYTLTERMRINNSTGNVSIGNTNDTHKLDVSGDVHIDGNIDFDFPGTANTQGEIIYQGTGTVVAGDLYYLNSSSVWTAVDADAAASATGLLGIALTTNAATGGMLLRGRARFTANANYTGVTTVGAPLYASVTPGDFSQTAPTGTGDIVRIIGYVLSASSDEIYFSPDNVWVEII